MSELDAIEARHENMPEEWTRRDASRAFRDRAFLLGWVDAQQEQIEHMTREFAVQYKTFRDGEWDRMFALNPVGNKPLTEEEAQQEVSNMVSARIPARLVSRTVSQWSPHEVSEPAA